MVQAIRKFGFAMVQTNGKPNKMAGILSTIGKQNTIGKQQTIGKQNSLLQSKIGACSIFQPPLYLL